VRQATTHNSNDRVLLKEQTARTVYIKGRHCNLAKSVELANVRSFKRMIVDIAGTVEIIDCKGDSIRIVCHTDTQKQKLLELSEIDGKQVTVSLPWSVKNATRPITVSTVNSRKNSG